MCLAPAVEAAKGTHVKIGAENLHFEDHGAFTGEVSADMLVDLGVQYVIIRVTAKDGNIITKPTKQLI